MIPSFSPVQWVVGGLILALSIAVGVQTIRLAGTQADLATSEKEKAEQITAWARAAFKAIDENAAKQIEHAAAQQENVYVFNQDRQKLKADRDTARAESERLRHDIAAFAAGSGIGTATDAIACRGIADRARTLGNLLGETESLAGEHTEAAERHAGEVRLLLRQVQSDRKACTHNSSME